MADEQKKTAGNPVADAISEIDAAFELDLERQLGKGSPAGKLWEDEWFRNKPEAPAARAPKPQQEQPRIPQGAFSAADLLSADELDRLSELRPAQPEPDVPPAPESAEVPAAPADPAPEPVRAPGRAPAAQPSAPSVSAGDFIPADFLSDLQAEMSDILSSGSETSRKSNPTLETMNFLTQSFKKAEQTAEFGAVREEANRILGALSESRPIRPARPAAPRPERPAEPQPEPVPEPQEPFRVEPQLKSQPAPAAEPEPLRVAPEAKPEEAAPQPPRDPEEDRRIARMIEKVMGVRMEDFVPGQDSGREEVKKDSGITIPGQHPESSPFFGSAETPDSPFSAVLEEITRPLMTRADEREREKAAAQAGQTPPPAERKPEPRPAEQPAVREPAPQTVRPAAPEQPEAPAVSAAPAPAAPEPPREEKKSIPTDAPMNVKDVQEMLNAGDETISKDIYDAFQVVMADFAAQEQNAAHRQKAAEQPQQKPAPQPPRQPRRPMREPSQPVQQAPAQQTVPPQQTARRPEAQPQQAVPQEPPVQRTRRPAMPQPEQPPMPSRTRRPAMPQQGGQVRPVPNPNPVAGSPRRPAVQNTGKINSQAEAEASFTMEQVTMEAQPMPVHRVGTSQDTGSMRKRRELQPAEVSAMQKKKQQAEPAQTRKAPERPAEKPKKQPAPQKAPKQPKASKISTARSGKGIGTAVRLAIAAAVLIVAGIVSFPFIRSFRQETALNKVVNQGRSICDGAQQVVLDRLRAGDELDEAAQYVAEHRSEVLEKTGFPDLDAREIRHVSIGIDGWIDRFEVTIPSGDDLYLVTLDITTGEGTAEIVPPLDAGTRPAGPEN